MNLISKQFASFSISSEGACFQLPKQFFVLKKLLNLSLQIMQPTGLVLYVMLTECTSLCDFTKVRWWIDTFIFIVLPTSRGMTYRRQQHWCRFITWAGHKRVELLLNLLVLGLVMVWEVMGGVWWQQVICHYSNVMGRDVHILGFEIFQ